MSLHDFVVENLQRAKHRWPQVARDSGVNYRTLMKIATRETIDPGVSHIEKLARYFREHSVN